MRTLYKKKAIKLYETRLRTGYVVMTVIFYILAAAIWYLLAVILPYTVTVNVSAADNAKITREAFSATADVISAPDSQKEHALLMPTSESSFCRRLKLIEDAQSTVDHMVFDTYEGKFSEYYYTALMRAADRGVKVRIVLDGKMGKLGGSLKEIGRMLQNYNNIQLYYFNELNILDPGAIMTLMHDKLLIVDGDKMIVGGVNMGTGAYMDNYDMEVMVTNSGEHGSVGQASDYYGKMLKSELTRRIISKKRDLSGRNKYEMNYLSYYYECEFANTEIDYSNLGIPADKITFVTNKISGRKKAPIILQAVFNLMESSKRSIAVTPYALLQNDKKREIRRLAAKNDEFLLITNSLYNTRNVGYADYYYTRKDYIDENIKLLEFQEKNQLHAKIFSFDGRYSIIGSFNMDERSAHIDTESVVIIDSVRFNAVLNEYINEVFTEKSLQVGKNNEYIPGGTVSSHSVPTKKRLIYGLYRMLGVVRCLL